MKNILKPATLLLCVGLMASCSKNSVVVPSDQEVVNPISDYTVTPDANDGFTFKFNSLAQNFTKLEWRFGDDTLKTDTNPTHTYLAPGTYDVDLEVYSKTGNFSHKEVPLVIDPEKVLALNAVKTGVDGQLKFSATLKGNIASILWTFNAVDPVTAAVTTTTSTDLSPVANFAFGSFNNFTVTATSDKGSIVTLSRSATTDGIVIDITPTNIGFHSTYEDTGNSNENSPKLIDGNTQTKFGYYSAFPGVENYDVYFPAPVVVKTYGLENGNDSESTRDPKEWYIQGSNDNGQTWDNLDHQNLTIGFADYLTSIGQSGTRYYRFFYYPIASPKAYTWYRWSILSTFAGAFQMMEFRLYK
ncbi:PKD domain-containing protein [Mucilaginibacter sp. dw_454]|uniref:PKD domain-containing protein n=1 Tax=Mucilaginibacter sp. dw_454 TaxID=2720079 RepID=UPI001BD65D2D|nr:PKD domain-containing protein [Mucilaginibacter sp. dw_454]